MKKILLTLLVLVAFTTSSYAQWYANRNIDLGGLVNIRNSKGYVEKSYGTDFYHSTCTTEKFQQGGSTDRITVEVLLEGKDINDVIQRYGSVTIYADVPNNKIILVNNSSVSVGFKIGAKWQGGSGTEFIKAGAGKTVSSSFYGKDIRGKDVRFTTLRLRHCNGLDRQ